MDQKKLSIVYIVQTLAVVGGLERIQTEKMNALSATGRYRVSVVCVCQEENTPNAFPLSTDVRQLCLGQVFDPKQPFRSNPLGFFLGRMKWRRQSKKRLKATLCALRPDVVVATVNHIPNGFYRLKAKTVLESHCNLSDTLRGRLMPWYSRMAIARDARHVSAVVTLTRDDAALWTFARRVEVIPNFTCQKAVGPCDYRSRRVVALGRLYEQKGFDLLVDAWKTVAERHPDWHLDIYGDGEQRDTLQRQIADGGLSQAVTLHPATVDVAAAYASAAFYVMSSRYEGFGLVLIEAMRCGLPCVSFDCPSGPSEIITDGRDGILVPYRGLSRKERVAGLAQALCRMMDHEEELPAMGRAAQAASQRYTAENVIPMWERLFAGL